MKRLYTNIISLILLFLVLCFCPNFSEGAIVKIRSKIGKNLTDASIQNRNAEKIVNGVRAFKREFPFMALLYKHLVLKKPALVCGGTIISDEWVLTAAHCLEGFENITLISKRLFSINHIVENDSNTFETNSLMLIGRISNLEVIAGEVDRLEISPINIRKAVYTYPYEYYDGDLIYHDIGAVKVNRKFFFNDLIRPAKLPKRGYEVPPFLSAYALGWGLESNTARHASYQLKKILVRVLPEELCSNFRFSSPNYRPFLCTANNDDGPCLGDSGGPLITLETVLLGIVSHGPSNCGKKGTVVKYTNTAFYRDWIKNVTGI